MAITRWGDTADYFIYCSANFAAAPSAVLYASNTVVLGISEDGILADFKKWRAEQKRGLNESHFVWPLAKGGGILLAAIPKGTSMSHNLHPSELRADSTRLEFLQYTHQDQQATIRLLDAKAGVFVSLLVLLIAGGLPLVKDVCAHLVWTGPARALGVAYVLSGGLTILSFIVTVFAVHHVIRPRQSEHAGIMHGVMFYGDILKHTDPEQFHDSANELSDHTLVKNFTTGIFNLSRIIQRKTVALDLAKWPTLATFVLWATNCAIAVTILINT